MIMRNELQGDGGADADGEDFDAGETGRPPRRGVMLRDFLSSMLDDVLTGEPPVEYRCTPERWVTLVLRPRQITCIGGPPNTGKTALLSQLAIDALLADTSLRAIIACVEMNDRVLMERTLARLSGVYLGRILKRERDDRIAARIEAARPRLESLADRLMFIPRPFTMRDVLASSAEFRPQIVLLDYLQRIPANESVLEMRQQVGLAMTQVRVLADQGPAVLAAAALNRQASGRSQSRAESTDDNVNDLAAYRDSSDIEYSLDDAYVLTNAPGNSVAMHGDEYRPKKLVLRHVKSRNNVPQHVPLLFDGRLQEFKLRAIDDGQNDGPRVATPPPRRPHRGFQTDNFLLGDLDGAEPV